MKRIIFDIDYTLLKQNYENELDFFKDYAMNEYFMNNIPKVLGDFENKHLKYNKLELLNYLNQFSSSNLDESFLMDWFKFNIELENQDVNDAKELLEYCKRKGIEIVALTNWFTDAQKRRLEKFGILKYFTKVIGTDMVKIKPNKEAYLMASRGLKMEECLFIGDSPKKDLDGPYQMGAKVIHFDNNYKNNTKYQKIREIKELKNIL